MNKIGNTIIHLEKTSSTNEFASESLSNKEQIDGTIVFAEYQTKGKGQGENIWESEKGSNILMSIILKPDFLQVEKQFFLSIAISLAVLKTINEFSNGICKIKWPNDIFLNDRKVAGILIQNTLSNNKYKKAIIGVGININQKQFGDNLTNASSIAIENKTKIDKGMFTKALILNLNKYYNKLIFGNYFELINLYKKNLFKINLLSDFILKDNSKISGIIKDIQDTGELIVEIDGKTKSFIHGEIRIVV